MTYNRKALAAWFDAQHMSMSEAFSTMQMLCLVALADIGGREAALSWHNNMRLVID